MHATRTYRPFHAPPRLDCGTWVASRRSFRADTCNPWSPMNPLTGICPASRTAPCYRDASPNGERHHSAAIVHCSLYIVHCPWSYTFSAKEKDSETGLSYFGSRYYSSDLSIWLSVDPMSGKYPSLSPYVYCADNPVKLVDPNGEEISTHIDGDGNVIAVINDGDLGVYQHADGDELTENQIIELQKQKGTSAGGKKIGETYYWDEFVSPETGKTMSNCKIQVGKSFDPIIRDMHKKSSEMNLIGIASESTGGGLFDIKKDYPNVGGLLLGKYVTSRSAGNFLAGYNASQGKYKGIGISFVTFQKLAGAVHIEESSGNRLSKSQMASIVLTGKLFLLHMVK